MIVETTHQEHIQFLKLIDLINKNKYFFDFIKWKKNHWANHNIYYQIKAVENYGSGGNFFHLFIYLKNKHIISYHFATETLEYSFKPWKSIGDYIDGDEDQTEGFGFEYNFKDYEEKRLIEGINLDFQEEA